MPAPYTDESVIVAKLDELKAVQESILALLAHIDSDHWDQAGATVPKAAILVNEYMGNQDLDGNGLVYGKDFHIDPACPDRPPMLADLPDDGFPATWADYLAGVE